MYKKINIPQYDTRVPESVKKDNDEKIKNTKEEIRKIEESLESLAKDTGKTGDKTDKKDECDDLFEDETPEQIKAREELDAKKKKEKEGKKKDDKKPAVIAKSIVLLDIKVFEIEQDLDALAKKVLSEIKKEGLLWKTEYKLLDVAFGIKKIRMGCVVEDEKVSVDDIIDEIQAWEDDVQSVDIVSFDKV